VQAWPREPFDENEDPRERAVIAQIVATRDTMYDVILLGDAACAARLRASAVWRATDALVRGLRVPDSVAGQLALTLRYATQRVSYAYGEAFEALYSQRVPPRLPDDGSW
jgi:hypothetical protein